MTWIESEVLRSGRIFFERAQEDRLILADMPPGEIRRYCGQGDHHHRRKEG